MNNYLIRAWNTVWGSKREETVGVCQSWYMLHEDAFLQTDG